MKKTVIIFLAVILATANIVQVATANEWNQIENLPEPTYKNSEAKEWTMGLSKNINGPTRGVQGSNGWYCLYTTETNKNGAFNLSQMKPAKWARTSNCWRYYGVSYNWSPEGAYSLPGYEFSSSSDWWLMDGNGRMDPAVGKGLVTGAYAWAAPKEGYYQISVDYVAGGSSDVYNGVRYFGTDGVTLSINTENGALSVFNAPATSKSNVELSKGNMSKTTSLKPGEMVYIVVDPQQSGAYAHAELKIDITQVEKEEDPSDESSEKDGNGDNINTDNPSGIGASDGGNSNGDTMGDETPNEEDPTDTEEEKKPEKKNQGDGNKSSSGGDNNGNGGTSGEDREHSPDGQAEPSASTDVQNAVEEDTESRTAEEEEEDTEDSAQYPVLVLSEEAAEKLTLALSEKETEDLAEEMEEEKETDNSMEVMQGKMAEYSGEVAVVDKDPDSMRLLLIIIIETLIVGAVFGAGKYYLNT